MSDTIWTPSTGAFTTVPTSKPAGAELPARSSGSIPAYYAASDVITGANLYTIFGSTGNMASNGAYFVKDSGQDNLHVNALGAIAGGSAWSAALLTALGYGPSD